MKLKYNGEVKESGLHIYQRADFDESIRNFMGKKVTITIQRMQNNRSLDQNSYYWKVIVPMVQDGLLDVGYRLDKEAVHNYLKENFHIIEHVNFKSGEIIKSIGSTTRMTTTSMMDYFAKIVQWAAEYLNIQIPEPNEQLKIQADESN